MTSEHNSYVYWNYNSGHSKSEIKTLSLIPNTDILVTLGKGEKELRLHDIYQRDNPLIANIESGNGQDNISCLDTFMFKGITGSKDSITYLDFNTGEKISEFKNKTSEGNSNLTGCKFMNDKLISVWSKDQTFSLYDIRKDNSGPKSQIFQFSGDNSYTCAGFTGNYINVGTNIGRVISLDLRKSVMHNDRVSNYSITSIESFSGDTILTSDFNGGVRIYNLDTGNILLHYEVDEEIINEKNGYKNGYDKKKHTDSDSEDDDNSIDHEGLKMKYNASFIPESNKLIHGTDFGKIEISKLNVTPTGKLPYGVSTEKPLIASYDTRDAKSQTINIVKYDKLKERLVATSLDGQLHIWDNLPL
ncbi:predicted protein [Candida tropicalis MYA-3404]|uniref:Anaphase-promoting complex subunit 4 WD40 domain-containing protein n=1 Tax=Candida tropicalis (strain ATCC MYA-3404 / T1) TaxID=294747 RepID=C5MFQ1_CANTT|nr:predicted protein [Candida tropicalis MYA-3404]EER31164.1 predicted protein [Candida tropicalis MYA-3404]KAG4404728.1 hypothetical protein JTP64_005742 [Candida tropicalis]